MLRYLSDLVCFSPQSNAASPSPELLRLTPTGVALWRTFETRRSSAEWYLSRYYEHLNVLEPNEPIEDLGGFPFPIISCTSISYTSAVHVDAAIHAAVSGTHQSQHLTGLRVCADRVARDVFMMQEILAYIQEVRSSSNAAKQLAIPGIAAAGR